MSAEVKGTLVNFWTRDQGQSVWRQLVCTEDSEFTISAELSKRKTNCGVKAKPGIPDFSASGNAVQNAEPTSTEASYAYIKERIRNGVIQEFKYQSAADVTEGLTEGEGIYNYGDGYFTNVTASASAEDDGILSFSWSFEGVGTIDSHESP
jgi:hypothetical protein